MPRQLCTCHAGTQHRHRLFRYPQKLFGDIGSKGAHGMRHDLYEFQICSSRYPALQPPDEEPLDSSSYYVLGLNTHMGNDTQRLRSTGTMQKY